MPVSGLPRVGQSLESIGKSVTTTEYTEWFKGPRSVPDWSMDWMTISKETWWPINVVNPVSSQPLGLPTCCMARFCSKNCASWMCCPWGREGTSSFWVFPSWATMSWAREVSTKRHSKTMSRRMFSVGMTALTVAPEYSRFSKWSWTVSSWSLLACESWSGNENEYC